MPLAPDHPLGHLFDPAALAALRLCLGLWRWRRALGRLRLRAAFPARSADGAPSR
jgi:hypothetical protein